jgi:hypothetical protein
LSLKILQNGVGQVALNKVIVILALSCVDLGFSRGLEPPPAANTPVAPADNTGSAPAEVKPPAETSAPAKPIWTEEKPEEIEQDEDPSEPESPKTEIKDPETEAKEPASDEPLTDYALYVSSGIHRVLANQMGGKLETGGATNLAFAWKLRDDDGSRLFGLVRYEPLAVTGRVSNVEVRGTINQYYFGVEQKRVMWDLNFNHSIEAGLSSSSLKSVDRAQDTPSKAKKSSLLLAYEAGFESFLSGKRMSVGAQSRLTFLQTQNLSINFTAKWYL